MAARKKSAGKPARKTGGKQSIGEYLIRRLQDYGIEHVFGIPGDFVLQFYGMLEESPIRVIGCTREDNAGYAADGYARVKGLGAVCVTYCVGGLSVCNSTAGAYAEKSPVVVISGSPGFGERENNPLLHHKVRDFRTQLDVFEKICGATAELSDPLTAFREIDRVLDHVARFKRPGYIELPRDIVHVAPYIGQNYCPPEFRSDPRAVAESADEAAAWLNRAKKPVILAGVEIHRFALQDELLALAESMGAPIATTLLGKSVIAETHPLFVGIYEGAMGRDEITRFVEESDCVLLLGAFMTDINLGIYTARLEPDKCIYATSEALRIRHHHYHGVQLGDFLRELRQRSPQPSKREIPAEVRPSTAPFVLDPDRPVTITRLFARLNEQLDEQTIVIADIGDSLFGATELVIRGRTEFLSPAYYTSMGFSVPAALGAQIARPECRVVAVCGDGAFQMTGMELSSLVRYQSSAIVIVLDNKGYGTERVLHSGDWKFNEIQPWKYSRLPDVFGGGKGYEVRSEREFDAALSAAWADRTQPSLIHVHIDVADHSSPLVRLSERLRTRV